MPDFRRELGALLSQGGATDDFESLKEYSKDESFARPIIPSCIARPANSDEVQKIVAWANKTKTPLIPVSSGPPHFRGDTVPGVAGAVVVDLSGMKKILSINRRNRMAVIEAGVSYAELQPALAQKGLRLSSPLLPRAGKSIITSLLEREPRLISRYVWSSMEPLRSLEVIFGDGNKIWTGGAGMDALDLEKQWQHEKWQIEPVGPGQTDFYRLMAASQGSIGIATWASLRCEVLPEVHRLYFASANNLDRLVDFTYQILRLRYADELFLLSRASLAYILARSPGQVADLKKELPAWTVLVGIAGRSELPEERVAFQADDISEIAAKSKLKLAPEIPGARGSDVLEILYGPPGEPSWKANFKGASQEIFFVSTLDRAPEFVAAMGAAAETAGYPTEDIGVYLQPRHQGVNCHIEFVLPYAPENAAEVTRVRKLQKQASLELFNQGAFFTRPYGEWADFAFKKDPQSTKMLKMVKGIFDPNGVMNPGKLCFKVKKAEVK